MKARKAEIATSFKNLKTKYNLIKKTKLVAHSCY